MHASNKDNDSKVTSLEGNSNAGRVSLDAGDIGEGQDVDEWGFGTIFDSEGTLPGGETTAVNSSEDVIWEDAALLGNGRPIDIKPRSREDSNRRGIVQEDVIRPDNDEDMFEIDLQAYTPNPNSIDIPPNSSQLMGDARVDDHSQDSDNLGFFSVHAVRVSMAQSNGNYWSWVYDCLSDITKLPNIFRRFILSFSYQTAAAKRSVASRPNDNQSTIDNSATATGTNAAPRLTRFWGRTWSAYYCWCADFEEQPLNNVFSSLYRPGIRWSMWNNRSPARNWRFTGRSAGDLEAARGEDTESQDGEEVD